MLNLFADSGHKKRIGEALQELIKLIETAENAFHINVI